MNKILEYNVTGQNIELASPAMLVAGTVNEYTARFSFGADWDGYQRIAVFSADGVEREQLLTDDVCKVPWEVLLPGAYLKVGVYGTKDGSRLPTIWTSHRQYIHDGAGPTEEAADPSPVLAEQILQRMGDLGALKTEDKSSLVAAINEIWMSGGGGASVTDASIDESGHLIITLSTGKTIDAGYAVGPVGPIGPPGENGKNGQDGVGIQSVTQTTTSTEDGGANIVTVTKTDGTTSTFEVRNGSRGSTGPAGADGKTAYQYAQEGGYTGTEAEFAEKLAAEIPSPYTLPIASETTLGGVQPVAKTDAMTQSVGVDAAGALWAIPGSGGSSGGWELLHEITIAEDVSYYKQDLNDEYSEIRFDFSNLWCVEGRSCGVCVGTNPKFGTTINGMTAGSFVNSSNYPAIGTVLIYRTSFGELGIIAGVNTGGNKGGCSVSYAKGTSQKITMVYFALSSYATNTMNAGAVFKIYGRK